MTYVECGAQLSGIGGKNMNEFGDDLNIESLVTGLTLSDATKPRHSVDVAIDTDEVHRLLNSLSRQESARMDFMDRRIDLILSGQRKIMDTISIMTHNMAADSRFSSSVMSPANGGKATRIVIYRISVLVSTLVWSH